MTPAKKEKKQEMSQEEIEEMKINLSILQDLQNLRDEAVFRREMLILLRKIAEALESLSIPSEEENKKK